MSKAWDKANMKSMAVNMKREDAEAFRALAEANGTTVGAMLRMFVQDTVHKAESEDSRTGGPGVLHVVSYRNTDRLKHETAFYNPNHKSPDGVLNEILDEYFAFVEKVRKRS